MKYLFTILLITGLTFAQDSTKYVNKYKNLQLKRIEAAEKELQDQWKELQTLKAFFITELKDTTNRKEKK